MEADLERRLNQLSSDWRVTTRGIGESSLGAAPVCAIRKQRCSNFASRAKALNVVIVGAERSDEFADAVRLARLGCNVIVVNPRERVAARRFANAGGIFIQSDIEQLPSMFGPFDLICESYPFTVARVEGVCEDNPCPMWLSARVMRAYTMARLRHLAPGGRWILFTESPGFARALRSIVRRDLGIQCTFNIRIVLLKTDEAPRSSYPHLRTRFKVIIQRHPAELRLSSGRAQRRPSYDTG
jgi:hypothetical protein